VTMRRNNKSFLNAGDLDATIHNVRGGGIMASKKDLSIEEDLFAAGCKLLLGAARGEQALVTKLLEVNENHINFRDYDRRTALHVAASEGHLEMVRYLMDKGAQVNRSDRWGGSPLDDALRHRHKEVAAFLRMKGGTTGNADKRTNLISAAHEGDFDEVTMLIEDKVDVNCCDYDKRTAIHLSAGEGQYKILNLLLQSGGDPNVEDRFGGRPLDDAERNGHTDCANLLKSMGGKNGKADGIASPRGKKKKVFEDDLENSGHALSPDLNVDSMKVAWKDIEVLDKLGAGEFGEIFKCRWRGNVVAAKCVKSAAIEKEWNKRDGADELNKSLNATNKEIALNDFRTETAILRQLRHPNICMLLAYSTMKDHEVMISELMKCSLLDVFKAHKIQGSTMSKKKQIRYAIELTKGMNYLHTCQPPILHRDLKPANLLVDFKDTLKISDFGLAKLRPEKDAQKKTDSFTMTGETGSYRFMAPEVFRHESYDETVDVYSFAMIFYNLLAGHAPWPSMNGVRAVKAAAIEGSRPQVPRHWDTDIAVLIQQCWDENPKARPPFSHILEVLCEYHFTTFKETVDDMTSLDNNIVEGRAACGCTIS